MTQLDALRLAETVRRRLVDFVTDDAFVRDPLLAAIAREIWSSSPERGGLVSDLWVEGAFPAALAQEPLDGLARVGHFDAELAAQLDRDDAVPRSRRLYTHQEEALRAAREPGPGGERPAIVVTAGTGAGKTEAFLLPILNDLWTAARLGGGMRCLILYPMNALVNDQVDRLYGWLRGQDRLTLFHFTSDTPEDRRAADRDGVPHWQACRMRTRQEARGLETREGHPLAPDARGRVPDIVITNYSMLEYMLSRPQDAVFFGPGLRAIVLDEAHLYTGTLAAEITLLLRRLLIRCGLGPDNVLQIATSATLGTGDAAELASFASALFSKDRNLVRVIAGRPAPLALEQAEPPARAPDAVTIAEAQWLDRPLLVRDEHGEAQLADDAGHSERLRAQLARLVGARRIEAAGPLETRPAVLLGRTLSASPIMHRLAGILWERRRLALAQLAEALWGVADEDAVRATVALLQLGASARLAASEYPLLPHRIHLVVRASDGLVVCVDDACSGDPARRLEPFGTGGSGGEDRCSACGAATLSLHRCANCGEWMLAGELQNDRLRPARTADSTVVLLTLHPRAEGTKLSVDASTGRRSGAAPGRPVLTVTQTCPGCGADRGDIGPFASRTPLALSIVAETVLTELPEYPSPAGAWLPARGRRLLAFSDSRAEAARLGPRLTRQHEAQLVRAAIAEVVQRNLVADEATLGSLREMLEMAEAQLALPGRTAGQRQLFETQRRGLQEQLRAASVGGSMDAWMQALAQRPVLAEILDPETAGGHEAARWTQRSWEENRRRVEARALSFLAREFASPVRRATSAETVGLAEVTYPGIEGLEPLPDLVGTLPTTAVRDAVRDCWTDLLRSLCDTLRTDGAITTGDDDLDRAYQFGAFIGRWAAERDERRNALIRFVGVTEKQGRRAFVASVLRAAGLSRTEAIERAPDVLRVVFEQLRGQAVPLGDEPTPERLPWIQTALRQTRDGPPAGAIRLVFPHLGLRRPARLFRCERTRQIWVRSVLGCAPVPGSAGTLQLVTEAELDEDLRVGRQRREYTNSPVFRTGLWAEEHSAQLAGKENRRLQDLFKAGIRNILSATTTLELGIDIGGLNAVLISNVPPGKANYLQRAGRAGRRADGSSVVLTFARPQPYDREVFRRVGAYLDRALRRPLVFLDRDRVVRRHFHAFLLGEFFRAIYPPDQRVGAMNAFGNMGVFCGVALPPRWSRHDHERPVVVQPPPIPSPSAPPPPWWNPARQATGPEAQFLEYLEWVRGWGEYVLRPVAERLFGRTNLAARLDDWSSLLDEVIQDFDGAVRSWHDDYDNLFLSWAVSDQRAQANAIRYQLAAQYELTVIEALADRQFLPHYGFPIGVHKLRVIAPDEERRGRIREEDQYRLERGSLLALREYVPGSQLLVGGKLVTSRGLLKHWTGANLDTSVGLRGQYSRCLNKHLFYSLSAAPGACPICGAGPESNARRLLFPKHGFSGAAWDPPKWSTDVERIGSAQTASMTFASQAQGEGAGHVVSGLGEVEGLQARYREDGELLVFNEGEYDSGFAICLGCGYAESEVSFGTGAMRLPPGFEQHAALESPSPWRQCRGPADVGVLRNETLAARETTDVLLVNFSNAIGPWSSHEPVITTLGYALMRAGAEMLELDTREIGVLTVPAGDQGRALGVLLHDATPGGAGHVRELLDRGREWLERTRTALFVDEAHHARCETACLDCLLTFDAQEAVRRGLFNRRLALGVLDALLEGRPIPGDGSDGSAARQAPTLPGTGPDQALSTEERLRAARERASHSTRRSR